MRALCLTLFLSVSLSLFSQITVTVENTPLRAALKKIEQVSNYKFFYNEKLAGLDQPVSFNVSNATIEQTLQKALAGKELTYRMEKDNVVVLLQKEAVNQKTKTITGTIVDQSGEPVIGASIVVKGTSNGTITDIDGNYTLTNVPENSTINISYIGYQPLTYPASSKELTKVTLKEDSEMLDEVVVVGYGTTKKANLSGAVDQISSKEIEHRVSGNAGQVLQGMIPNLNVSFSDGSINSKATFDVRGVGSINGGKPLVLIDGVEGDMNYINPKDIESISVLKDASSAAIYGARAANGVILITTKRGKTGVAEVSYDGYVGVQNLYKIPTILNAQEYMMMQDEGRVMDGLSPYNWATYIPERDLQAIQNGTWKGTNWLKEVLNEDALVQNHAVNITGGTDRSRYAIGISYTNQEATMGVPGEFPEMNRYNFRVNSDHVVMKKGNLDFLKVGETINYKYSQTQGSFGTGGIYWNGVHNMLIMSPLMHPYNSDGDYYLYADQEKDNYKWDISNGANKNPIAYLDYYMNQNLSKSHYMQSSFYAELQPIKNLRIKSQFGYIMGASSYRSYLPRFDYLSASLNNAEDKVTQSMSMYNRWSWDNTANYIFNIDDHNIDVLVGQSIEKWGMGEEMSGSAIGSNFYDFKHAYLSNVPLTANSVSSLTGKPNGEGSIASFFGRVNYNYQEKYMASVIMRADGSSTFARGHRWGYFPSVSAGWVISNESFMSGIKWLDFLKLRASWGQNGNCNVSTFQYLSLITSNNGYGGYTFGDSMDLISTGSYAYRLTNPDLTWETQEQLNFGIDARFLNNRLGFEFDWYNKNTRDWLVTAPVLSSFGANAVSVNGGNVKNTGIEVGLHWNDNIGKDFQYGANLTLAHNKNEVTKIANKDGIIHGSGSVLWEGAEECFRAEVGKPIGYFYGYKSNGIFQNQEQIDNYKGPKLNGDKTQPGDVIWADTDNSGTLDANDRTMIGNPNPDLTMGLSLNASWKAIDFSITTYGAFGQQILKCYRDFSSSPLNNYTAEIFQRWHGEGTSDKFPRLSSASSSNWNRVSDIYIENGDYLKIKNITVGFDFKKAFKKLPVQQLRLYLTAQNLFTFTGYSGMDPEIGYGGDDYGWASGIDLGYYPSARTYMIGLNVKF